MTGSQGNIWRAAFVNLELEKKIYQIRFKHSLPENSDCGFPPCPECNAMNKCPNANVAIAGIRLDCHKDAPKAPLETCRKREVPLAGCEILAVSPSSEGKSQITCMSLRTVYKTIGLSVILGSLSNDVFERRTSTGSCPFSFLGDGFAQIFSQIVSIRVKKLSNTNYIASRHTTREKSSLPVDVRCSKMSLLKLPNDVTVACDHALSLYLF